METLKPDALPLLIGSLPMDSHEDATKLVFEYTPQIPVWVQLPNFREEGMIDQFLPGLPGLTAGKNKNFINTSDPELNKEFLAYFEEYLSVSESGDIGSSRFAFTPYEGKGFFEFLRQADRPKTLFTALKGQVTGPVTIGTRINDEKDRNIFYNDQLRDALVKKLALNARWQAQEFAKKGALPIIFIDEPALAGFGTSAYITITRQDVVQSLEEIIGAIHSENGLAGIHVCANTEWDMLLDSEVDIISFDAYSYFDKFILYPENIKKFIDKGGLIAWGIIPTSEPRIIKRQTVRKLVEKFMKYMDQLSGILGIEKDIIREKSFITPSCGTGSLDFDSALSVLKLTREVSEAVRKS